jgi:hypothetical protein
MQGINEKLELDLERFEGDDETSEKILKDLLIKNASKQSLYQLIVPLLMTHRESQIYYSECKRRLKVVNSS